MFGNIMRKGFPPATSGAAEAFLARQTRKEGRGKWEAEDKRLRVDERSSHKKTQTVPMVWLVSGAVWIALLCALRRVRANINA